MQTVDEALSQARFIGDDGVYKVVRLHARAITAAAGILAEIGEPFLALIADKDEVSLILDEEALEEYHNRLPGHVVGTETYRLITCDVVLEPTLVGFMARVSTALAEAQIPIFPYAAYTRDHLLVPSEHFNRALEVLQGLQKN